MPQGWRPTHPGDPTPGLSKAGRLVIVIAVAVGVAIALMVIAVRPAGASDGVASPAISQEPSPPPWFGGRVEMPEHGFAVTLPDGWVAIDVTGDVDEQAWVTFMVLDPIATADDVRYVSELMTRVRSEGAELVLLEGLTGSFCGFNVTAKRAIETGEFADRLASRMSSDDRFTDVERPRAIELPAGPTFVVDGTFTKLDPPGPSPVAYYLVDADESVLIANCTGAERPEDDWLSIAETFEFLPEEE